MEQTRHLESFVDYEAQDDFELPVEVGGKLDDDDDEVLDGFGYAPVPRVFPSNDEDDANELPPVERVERLFQGMVPHRLTLVGILMLCDAPTSHEDIEAYVLKVAGSRPTVFNAATYVRMLVEAGALQKVTEDGAPYDSIDLSPVEVERDGQRYLEPVEPPAEFWRATDAGLEVAAPYRPQDLLPQLFKDEERFVPVFERILEMCDAAGGAPIDAIKAAVNGDPILIEARKTAQFLIDYLERAGALTYNKGWTTTQHGSDALKALKSRED